MSTGEESDNYTADHYVNTPRIAEFGRYFMNQVVSEALQAMNKCAFMLVSQRHRRE